MSFKDKIYNSEAIPPANAWDKIAAALDRSQDEDKVSSVLYNLEVTPPTRAWNQIVSSLDAETWDASYPSRLYDLEIAPPFNTWNKIISGLEPAQVATPNRRVIPIFMRYAAAAIFIGFAVFAVIKLSTGKTKSDLTDQAKSVVPAEQSTSNSLSGSAKDIATNAGPLREDTLINNAKIAAIDKPAKMYKVTGSSSETKALTSAGFTQAKKLYAYQTRRTKIADRYFMLLTPNGNFIRMSKKWGSMVCCVSGEEQDPDCKDQLQKWQEKIADSPITPGPGNFIDILSLVNSLNESSEL